MMYSPNVFLFMKSESMTFTCYVCEQIGGSKCIRM